MSPRGPREVADRASRAGGSGRLPYCYGGSRDKATRKPMAW